MTLPNVSILTPLDDPRYQYRACPRCDRVFKCFTGNGPDLCPACCKELEEKQPRVDRRKDGCGVPVWWNILHDPTGDFPKGAAFESKNFIYSLYDGVFCAGTVIEHAGVVYTVDDNGDLVDGEGRRYHANMYKIQRVS